MSDLITERSGDLLELTLNRPDRANALSPNLVEQLISAFENLGDARLVVLRGSGKSFCSGFDLHDIAELSDGDLLWRFVRIERLLQLIHHAPIPVAAFAHRHAVGAGADVLACASTRVVAPGTIARMPGLNFGIVLGTRRLAGLVGQAGARDVLIDTRSIDHVEALEIGLAHKVAAIDDWPEVIEQTLIRSRVLSKPAMARMLEATRIDTRAVDMAALVQSAAEPGLCDRVQSYIEQVKQTRRQQ